jgi:secretion/DNA translocation related TadE-like protein
VITVALMAVLILVAGVLAAAGSVVVSRHRAEAVADVAALAAAQHAERGPLVACAAAWVLVKQQAATLESCRLDGLDAVVVVGVRPPGRAASLGLVRGRARAGRRGAVGTACRTCPSYRKKPGRKHRSA